MSGFGRLVALVYKKHATIKQEVLSTKQDAKDILIDTAAEIASLATAAAQQCVEHAAAVVEPCADLLPSLSLDEPVKACAIQIEEPVVSKPELVDNPVMNMIAHDMNDSTDNLLKRTIHVEAKSLRINPQDEKIVKCEVAHEIPAVVKSGHACSFPDLRAQAKGGEILSSTPSVEAMIRYLRREAESRTVDVPVTIPPTTSLGSYLQPFDSSYRPAAEVISVAEIEVPEKQEYVLTLEEFKKQKGRMTLLERFLN
jgi:hypothetical protein